MKWEKAALDEISRVPFFVRGRVKTRVEEEARSRGAKVVRPVHVAAAKASFLGRMEKEVAGFRLEGCFGETGCPNRAADSAGLIEKLEELLAGYNLRDFLAERVAGPLKLHHEFRVTIADCPNGCSRPQIVDIGLIGAKEPRLTGEECTACGDCVETCKEDAVSLPTDEGPPAVDGERCLLCGQCIEVCPTGTIGTAREGFRILAGGKLGRHPQLGLELGGIYSPEVTLKIVKRCLDIYLEHNLRGERLGEIVIRLGFDDFARKSLA